MANVSTEDRWSAIDALDALPETHETDWYKRLVEAAELATQAELIQSGVVTRHWGELHARSVTSGAG